MRIFVFFRPGRFPETRIFVFFTSCFFKKTKKTKDEVNVFVVGTYALNVRMGKEHPSKYECRNRIRLFNLDAGELQ